MIENMQWEYLVMTLGSFWSNGNDEDIGERLNEIGEEGWEVVSVYPMEGTHKARLVAKRVLTTRTKRERTLPGY